MYTEDTIRSLASVTHSLRLYLASHPIQLANPIYYIYIILHSSQAHRKVVQHLASGLAYI